MVGRVQISEERWRVVLSPEHFRKPKRPEEYTTKTTFANNLMWYIYVVIKLHGPAGMFALVGGYKWHLHWFNMGVFYVCWLLIVTYVHIQLEAAIAYYMLAIYRLDQTIKIRLLKIVIYSSIYVFYAAPNDIDWIRVYVPVAHSLTGIITCKLYGYNTRELIVEFTYLVTPPFFDLLRVGIYKRTATSFTARYFDAFVYLVVILTGVSALVTPKVVPPRRKNTPISVPADLELGANAGVPPPILATPDQIKEVAADVSTAATDLLTAAPEIPDVVAASIAATAALTKANTIDAGTTAQDIAITAATVASAAAASKAAAAAATAAAPDNADLADCAIRAATNYAKAAKIANKAVAGTERGQLTFTNIIKGWLKSLRDDCKKVIDIKVWKKWLNPGDIADYEDFIMFT